MDPQIHRKKSQPASSGGVLNWDRFDWSSFESMKTPDISTSDAPDSDNTLVLKEGCMEGATSNVVVVGTGTSSISSKNRVRGGESNPPRSQLSSSGSSSQHRIDDDPSHCRRKRHVIQVKLINLNPQADVLSPPMRTRRQVNPVIDSKIAEEIVTKSAQVSQSCTVCGSEASIIYDTDIGMRVCTVCSSEQSSFISSEQEWHNYTDSSSRNGPDQARCGDAVDPLIGGTGVTYIGHYRRCDRSFRRVHGWNAEDPAARARRETLARMRDAAAANHVSTKAIDKAAVVFMEVQKINPRVRGSGLQRKMAGSIYMEMRRSAEFCPSTQVACFYGLRQKEVNKGHREIQESLFMQNPEYLIQSGRPTSTQEFIDYYCRTIGVTKESLLQKMYHMATVEKSRGLVPNSRPEMIAVSIIYFCIAKFERDTSLIELLLSTTSINRTSIRRVAHVLSDYYLVIFPPSDSLGC